MKLLFCAFYGFKFDNDNKGRYSYHIIVGLPERQKVDAYPSSTLYYRLCR